MAGIITKFKYLKPASNQKPSGYVNYIATREGVEKIVEKKTYADYIATRPRSNGLFSSGDEPISLSKVSKEIDEYEGNIWTGIISLKREDAERLGYDNFANWKNLLNSEIDVISKNFKIPIDNLQWYAAFHNEGHHPHVHMIIYSKNPNEGYLSKQGVNSIRSALANKVFEQDLISVFKKQTEYRDGLKAEVKQKTLEISSNIKSDSSYQNVEIEKMLKILSERLRNTSGKKVYGYLSKSNKDLVNNIVKEIAKDPRIAELYNLWYEEKENTIKIYTDNMPERMQLWENPEFKSIKNIVIKTALSSENTLQDAKINQNTPCFAAFELLADVAGIFEAKQDINVDNKAKIDKKDLKKISEKRELRGLHY